MTPKEKAVKLVEKLKQITVKYVLNGMANEGDINDEAKECALICCEEMLSVDPSIISDESYFPYLEEVKKEIIAL